MLNVGLLLRALLLTTSQLVNLATNVDQLPDGGLNHVICVTEVFRATCEVDEVILITHALYGRMRTSRCVREFFGYPCSHDVTLWMDSYCSGRHDCQLKLAEDVFPGVPLCHPDLKSYLNVTYTCVKVSTPPSMLCNHMQPVILAEPRGYISNLVSHETSCGTSASPWEIQTEAGKQVRITLLDFMLKSSPVYHDGRININSKMCRVYATLREKEQTHTATVCAATTRESHVFTSSTNSVQVFVLGNKPSDEQQTYFLLKYEVVGCSDPSPPESGWVRRSEDVALIGCDRDNVKATTLTCHVDGTWQGQRPNCTKGSGQALSKSPGDSDHVTLPVGVVLVVILGLALVIGLLVLVLGLCCMARTTGRNSCPNSRRLLHTESCPESGVAQGATGNGATHHELCPNHAVRAQHCDYEPCAVHRTANIPAGKEADYSALPLLRTTPDVIQPQQPPPEALYDQKRSAENTSNDATECAFIQTRELKQVPSTSTIGPTKAVFRGDPLYAPRSHIQRVNSSDALLMLSPRLRRHVATILAPLAHGDLKLQCPSSVNTTSSCSTQPAIDNHNALVTTSVPCTNAAISTHNVLVSSSSALVQTGESTLPNMGRVNSSELPSHTYVCIKSGKQHGEISCMCPPGHVTMSTFKPV